MNFPFPGLELGLPPVLLLGHALFWIPSVAPPCRETAPSWRCQMLPAPDSRPAPATPRCGDLLRGVPPGWAGYQGISRQSGYIANI